MKNNKRCQFVALIVGGMMIAINGCATSPDGKVRHGFELEVDKSIGEARNIRYTYGDDFVNRTRANGDSVSPLFSYVAPMRVPEEFLISWETLDGNRHEAKVPVRGRLRRSLENKTISFLIFQDRVEGYVVELTPKGRKKEQFY